YIPKSSTNGFLEEAFQQWLADHPGITDFVVAGVCTDICVMQFCLTAKAWFNKNGIKSRIILPLNVVETYEKGGHQITLTNTMAVYFMEESGAEVYYEINLRGYNPIRIIDESTGGEK
ncbi:MAG: isochorismatase family protein, partial [Firmicutes bacterium]|nr:isochorismatase family protein [Bacillota bacterium]